MSVYLMASPSCCTQQALVDWDGDGIKFSFRLWSGFSSEGLLDLCSYRFTNLPLPQSIPTIPKKNTLKGFPRIMFSGEQTSQILSPLLSGGVPLVLLSSLCGCGVLKYS